MSSTRTLAKYISEIRCEELPPVVVEKGKLAGGNAARIYNLN